MHKDQPLKIWRWLYWKKKGDQLSTFIIVLAVLPKDLKTIMIDWWLSKVAAEMIKWPILAKRSTKWEAKEWAETQLHGKFQETHDMDNLRKGHLCEYVVIWIATKYKLLKQTISKSRSLLQKRVENIGRVDRVETLKFKTYLILSLPVLKRSIR